MFMTLLIHLITFISKMTFMIISFSDHVQWFFLLPIHS